MPNKAILPAFCTVVILERFVDWQMGHLGVTLARVMSVRIVSISGNNKVRNMLNVI